MKLLMAGRLTMICWVMKSSEVTVKSETLPSLLPFLVSTLRPMRLKLRPIMRSILMTSLDVISSSILSTTMPKLEYSRTEEAAKRLAGDLPMRGPLRRKAMMVRLSGSVIVSET